MVWATLDGSNRLLQLLEDLVGQFGDLCADVERGFGDIEVAHSAAPVQLLGVDDRMFRFELRDPFGEALEFGLLLGLTCQLCHRGHCAWRRLGWYGRGVARQADQERR